MKHLFLSLFCAVVVSRCEAQSWTTYRADNARSGNAEAQLDCSKLAPAWSWQSPVAPDPAWDGPARWDAYAKIRDLPAMRGYDACFHPVSDGELLFFGSSSQDSLFALDLATGQPQWTFVANGPIRLAPTVAGDRLYFGCDDGYAYCLDKSSGKLQWKFSPSEAKHAENRRLINNDRLISCYPIRTGITVRDGIAYFAASFMPWRESYICAVDATTGEVSTDRPTFVVEHPDATLEGSLLVAENRLIVPQGRVAPLLFDRTTGKKLGNLPGGGGVTIVLTPSGDVVRAEGGREARSGQVGVFQGKERVASFPRGRSIVVDPEFFFVIDGEKLMAAKRQGNELQWERSVDEPLELIRSGRHLLVGGRDHVTAVDAETGEITWSAKVEGRAYGLAVAGQQLIVSTDQGKLYGFSETAPTSWKPGQRPTQESAPSPPVPAVREKNLLHRWVFHRSGMRDGTGQPVNTTHLKSAHVLDQEGDAQAVLSGTAKSIAIGESDKVEGVDLNGGFFPIDKRFIKSLPSEAISAEAWVRVDAPMQWGGVVGCIQDDGTTEHGWVLGFSDDKFSFGLAGSGSGLTYLKSSKTFVNETWNHLVGTYNGQEMRLYVNGSLAASSQAEQGPISYSDACHFTLGAYKDANENYPLQGGLHEVRLYSVPLDGPSVQRLYESRKADFPEPSVTTPVENRFLTWGPYANYLDSGQVEIRYGTRSACPTMADVIGGDAVRRISGSTDNTQSHRIVLSDLPYRREIQYQLRSGAADDAEISNSYSLDTHFDWGRGNQSQPTKEIASILDQAANPRGLAIVVGESMADQAYNLAAGSQFHVVLVTETDAASQRVRQAWQERSKTGEPVVHYGKQLSAIAIPLEQLPAAFATVVLSENNNDQARRLVRPAGGILHDGSQVAWKREPLKGAGDWSHMYGQADNSAFGGETLSQASTRQDLVAQWVGRPGPRYQTDRQNRKPSPLAVGGRLFLQGQQRMIALDSYSGSILWSVESPTVMRWNVPHDCSNWCADTEAVYVAAEHEAWKIDGRNGNIQKRFQLPLDNPDPSKAWGYIARHDQLLLGTAMKRDATYLDWWGGEHWFDSTAGADTHLVAGDLLFALDASSGETAWKYPGLVLHPTITVMDGRLYFIEDRTPEHVQGATRRISIDENQQHELVCLEMETGKKLWAQPLETFQGHLSCLYLAGGGSAKQRCLILSGSEAKAQEFTIRSFDPNTGQRNWKRSVAWETNHHGKHISRPAIQGELLYLRPEVMDLASGQTITRGFPPGHGCSSYSLSTQGLFTRLGETTWWDVRNDKVNRFPRVRTDCWISVVPAQGMVLSAEGGGGCSCGSWLETSIGFIPRSVNESLPDE
ncbi:MAG: PQQ-binding-like beta-propeller repeat protein [Mariniblastus sp.]|nr:PQQ-binding-like beta-propeller repeat protein [Mariniblastus sp.]